MLKKGLFITFEGPEGSGKTTQIELLKKELESQGYAVVVTREPGGTEIGKKIRKILLDVQNDGMSFKTELFLYAADRIDHVEKIIRPAISEKSVVLCDRYIDSTVAYQGAGRNIGAKFIEDLMLLAVDGLQPDLTVLIDIDPSKGVNRAIQKEAYKNTNGDRIEREGLDFHQRVRSGYLELAEKYPQRIKKISGEQGIDAIHKEIKDIVGALINAN